MVWLRDLEQQDLATLKKVWIFLSEEYIHMCNDVSNNNLFTNSIKADREI